MPKFNFSLNAVIATLGTKNVKFKIAEIPLQIVYVIFNFIRERVMEMF